jgi:hypothetical protein
MLLRTVQEIREYTDGERPHGYRLYLIQDGEIVLYIGQSFHPFQRIKEHLGEGNRDDNRPSKVGQLILAYYSVAATWPIQFYTLKECQPYVTQHIPSWFDRRYYEQNMGKRASQRDCMNIAEEALIRMFRPCLNIQKNNQETKTPLPKRYQELLGEQRDCS